MVIKCETSEILQESNTKSCKIEKGKDTQRKYWAFTLYPNEATNQVEMIKRFETTFLKFCFGREKCPTTNRLHWQGFATARGKGYRFSQLTKQYPGVHWSPTYANEEQNLAYCKKDGDWEQRGYPAPIVTIECLRPWQEAVKAKILAPPDGRSITWVWEPNGNIGKSAFAKHMIVRYNCTYIDQGKKADIINHIFNTDMDKCGGIIIDIPRNTGNKISYSAVESLLNGMIFNSKYETGSKLFNPVNICVFSNFPPERTMLSGDRWKVFEIRDGELI